MKDLPSFGTDEQTLCDKLIPPPFYFKLVLKESQESRMEAKSVNVVLKYSCSTAHVALEYSCSTRILISY